MSLEKLLQTAAIDVTMADRSYVFFQCKDILASIESHILHELTALTVPHKIVVLIIKKENVSSANNLCLL